MIQNLIFDFDSTMLKVEAIEILVEIGLEKFEASERQFRLDSLKSLAMRTEAGEIARGHKMNEQLLTAKINRDDVDKAARKIYAYQDPNVKESITTLQQLNKQIFIFSRGFDELVFPITNYLAIPERNVFVNHLVYDAEGNVTKVDDSNPLFLLNGKVYLAESLQSQGRLVGSTAVIGNCLADLSIRKSNIADYFIYYSANLQQESVRKEADFFIDHFEQLLPLICSTINAKIKLNTKHKATIFEKKGNYQIVLLENIHKNAQKKLSKNQFNIKSYAHTAKGEHLYELTADSHVIGIRSKTQIRAADLSQMPDLTAIGCFCIGTDQVDLIAAANQGIPVFNAPYANTRSVAELVVGEVVMLMRHAFEKSTALHESQWLKSARDCHEVRGKVVGIVGYGHIGSQVSILFENLGMHVIFYDIVDKLPLGNARPVDSLDELLQSADVVTLHVPDTPLTRNMISEPQLDLMKPSSFLINTSRGKVVDLNALAETLRDGKLGGAAVDVFPNEPVSSNDTFSFPLQGLPNVILTPHIGGSTQEAQAAIAQDVSSKIEKFLKTGSTLGAINFPEVELALMENTHRVLHVHKNVPGVLSKINDVFSRHNINIEAQMLKTQGTIGYLIVDVNTDVSEQVADLLARITETIKVRRID